MDKYKPWLLCSICGESLPIMGTTVSLCQSRKCRELLTQKHYEEIERRKKLRNKRGR